MNTATGAESRRCPIPTRRLMMTKTLLAMGAAAVALTGLSVPTTADARRVCNNWRHGQCVKWRQTNRVAAYRSGYRFGPRYAYTSYRTLPRAYVSRYDLSPNYR